MSETPSTSEVSATLTFEDLVIKVDDAVPLNPVFNPTSAASAITYEIEDPTIVSISRSGILLGLVPGVTNVTATSETELTDTFQVTVEENDRPEVTALEEFAIIGQFEEANLPGWQLSGPSAEKHAIDIDADREQDDSQLKLWPGDFDEEDETASLVDFTLTLVYDGEFEASDYTLVFDLVGNIDVIEVELEGTSYTKALKQVNIGGAAYRTTYIEFSLNEAQTLDLSFMFQSPGTQANWGFLDDVNLEEGHTKPELPVDPDDGNLLNDGSFEIASAQVGFLDENSNEFLDWQIEGTLRTMESISFDEWTTQGDFSLKYNYYPNSVDSERPVGDMKVYQYFTIEEAGMFDLSYYVAAGGIINTKLIIIVDDIEVYAHDVPNSSTYSKQTLNDIELPAGEAEFRIHFQEDKDTWIHLDYILLTAQ